MFGWVKRIKRIRLKNSNVQIETNNPLLLQQQINHPCHVLLPVTNYMDWRMRGYCLVSNVVFKIGQVEYRMFARDF